MTNCILCKKFGCALDLESVFVNNHLNNFQGITTVDWVPETEAVYFKCEYVTKVNNTSSDKEDRSLSCREMPPEDCADWSFSGSKTTTDLAVMTLNTFALRPDKRDRTVLNVSLNNIRFTSLRYRIQRIGQSNITFCTEVELPAAVNVSNLHFDCFWKGTVEIGTEYQLEYEAQKGTLREARTFLFRIHSKKEYEDIGKWFPFLYIDRTEFPLLIARWHQTPSDLERPNYTVTVYDKDRELESVTVRGTDQNSGIDELCYKYTCSMFPVYGSYSVKLQVLCANGGCQKVESPIIFTGNSSTMILIACVTSFAFVILIVAVILYVWKKRNQPYFDINKLPKVLILYSPSTQSHIRTVTTLAEYLRENCFVVALLDLLDVSRTETKDPFVWYNEAFRRADFIMVISSPPKCCNQGIFKNVDVLALNFVSELLSHHNRPHIFNVTLNYCGEEHIPKETMNFHSYRLTKDMDRMLWYIHKKGKFPTFIDFVYRFLTPKVCGGKSDLKTYRGRALLGALKAAENPEINACNCKNINIVENVNSALNQIPEMVDYEGENLYVSNSNGAVNMELNKFFIDLENLNLSGEDDYTVQPVNKEPNLLNFLKL